eukprot:NODE_396_length_2301_cov_27.009200_g367_i0.p1 GENE.NODE_396_length_2301_cov_27.009200_g367_i0~~NODE_396_length_2301_cov_27.009200_g367_i0.p1  ORF type:complete len:721 (-),score=168.90 NODE_396_length_2301_cov_27.009200_g367_i0:79-2241(-)
MEAHGYRPVKLIGRGSYGHATLAEGPDGKPWVVKSINLAALSECERALVDREIPVLKQLTHPNITLYQDSFTHMDTLHIVMEYADSGSLQGLLDGLRQRGATLNEEKVYHYFCQLLSALNHLHGVKVLHRDLAPKNVFLTQNKSVVKLGDFGISTFLNATGAMVATQCGTPHYYSPELCMSRPYNSKSDIWALGCVLYQLMTCRPPFEAPSMPALMARICAGEYRPVPSHFSSELRNLLGSMLNVASKRPNAAQLLAMPCVRNHFYSPEAGPLLANGVGIGREIQPDLSDRIDAEAVAPKGTPTRTPIRPRASASITAALQAAQQLEQERQVLAAKEHNLQVWEAQLREKEAQLNQAERVDTPHHLELKQLRGRVAALEGNTPPKQSVNVNVNMQANGWRKPASDVSVQRLEQQILKAQPKIRPPHKPPMPNPVPRRKDPTALPSLPDESPTPQQPAGPTTPASAIPPSGPCPVRPPARRMDQLKKKKAAGPLESPQVSVPPTKASPPSDPQQNGRKVAANPNKALPASAPPPKKTKKVPATPKAAPISEPPEKEKKVPATPKAAPISEPPEKEKKVSVPPNKALPTSEPPLQKGNKVSVPPNKALPTSEPPLQKGNKGPPQKRGGTKKPKPHKGTHSGPFRVDGTTVHLPSVNADDPLTHRTEALRMHLEQSLGPRFLQWYRALANGDPIPTMHTDTHEQGFLQLIRQLLQCERELFGL